MSSSKEEQEVSDPTGEGKTVITIPFKRLIAFIIDYSVIMLFLMSLNPLFLPHEWDQLSFKMIIISLTPLYIIGIIVFFCKDIFFGTSIGKAFLGLRITNIDENFSAANPRKVIIRNLYLLLFPIELYFLMTNKYCQRLGDQKMGTIVVERRRPLVIRAVTKRVLGFLLIMSAVWLLYVTITPIGIKKTASYTLMMNSIQSNSEVFEKIGRIKSIGYWPEVSYRGDKIVFRIEAEGEKATETLQTVIEIKDKSYKLHSLLVLDNKEE